MQQTFKKEFSSLTILGSVHALSQEHEVEEATDDKREQPGETEKVEEPMAFTNDDVSKAIGYRNKNENVWSIQFQMVFIYMSSARIEIG